MIALVLRRLGLGLATILLVTTGTFALIHAAPGEPFAATLDDARTTPEVRAAFRERYGLDLPVSQQFARYMGGLLRGDLGTSIGFGRPVITLIRERMPRTLLLMGTALVVGFALGIVLGVRQAEHVGSPFDRWTERITVALGALPDFWIALALLLVLAFTLRWFPVSGMVDDSMHEFYSPLRKVRDIAWHLTLPALSMALLVTAGVARFQRAAILETMPNDYIRSARAKGITRAGVVRRHALRNALIPTITLFGLSLPSMVGGAVFIETIFRWPGVGSLAVQAIGGRDYPVVLGVTLVASVMVVIAGIVADLAYSWADPRTRHG